MCKNIEFSITKYGTILLKKFPFCSILSPDHFVNLKPKNPGLKHPSFLIMFANNAFEKHTCSLHHHNLQEVKANLMDGWEEYCIGFISFGHKLFKATKLKRRIEEPRLVNHS